MRLWIYILAGLVLGGLLATSISNQHGFLVIVWEKTSIEMRLWLAITLLLLCIICVFTLAWFIYSLKHSRKKIQSWWGNRSSHKSYQHTLSGLIALNEGYWKKAEQHFIKASTYSKAKLMSYLFSAKAAHQQHLFKQRNDYLQEAAKIEPADNIAVCMTQAELQFMNKQYEESLASLTQLYKKAPKHPYLLKQLIQCYQQLKDWPKLYCLLPDIKKLNVLSEADYTELMIHCSQQQLIICAQKDKDTLLSLWKNMPADYKKNKPIILYFIRLLIELKEYDAAEVQIRTSLKREYDSELIYWYSYAANNDHKHLAFIESFAKDEPNDHLLFFAMGFTAYKNQLWGKAQTYLNRCVQLNGPSEAYQILIDTYIQLNEPEQAQKIMQSGLAKLIQRTTPSLLDIHPSIQLTSSSTHS